MIQASTLYDEISFDYSEINQSLLDIENKQRSNLFAWNGQFSPQFIETLLDNYAGDSHAVADPFLGSGTVLYECARKGISAYGVELNPSAYYMSTVYQFCKAKPDEREVLTSKIESILEEVYSSEIPLESLKTHVAKVEDRQIKNTLSLIVVMLDLFNNEFSVELIKTKWLKLKAIILELPYTSSDIKAYLGDARNTPIAENSIDLVITSPPYINVFNYHQKYRRSVEALGFDVLNIAKKEVGSNRKHRGNRLLTVVQYCIDMGLALEEMMRICKEDTRIILVVGRESNVLSTSFCNSKLIYDIADRILGLPLLLKQERVFKNRYGQNIYEDILHFKNSPASREFSNTELIEDSRQVAVEALVSKVQSMDVEDKNYDLFISAIENSQSIKESEGLL